MLKRTLAILFSVGLALCCTARASDYVVDVKGEADLDHVTAYERDGTPITGADRDFTAVGSADRLYLTNTDTTARTSQTSGLAVNGGQLHIGYDDGGAAAAEGITINLQDSGNFKGDFVISGGGSATLGQAGSAKTISITNGGTLDIVDGTLSFAAGVGANVSLAFETMNFANGTVTMADDNARLTISGITTVGDGDAGNALLVVNGTGASFVGGLQLNKGGTIRAGGAATVRFGSNNNGLLMLAGGTLENTTASDLVFNTKRVSVEGDHKSVITATGGGNIQLGDGTNTALGVNQDLDVIGARLSVETYTQRSGTVAILSGGSLTAKGAATVTGAESVFYGTGVFEEGVAFTSGATLGGAVDSLITTASGKPITIDAKSYLDLTSNTVTLGASTALEMSGTVRVGVGSLDVATNTGAGVTFNSGSVLRVDEAYRGQNLTGQVVVAANGLTSVQGFDQTSHKDDHFLLGEFHFAQAQTAGGGYNAGDIYISKSVAGEKLDGTDFDKVRQRVVDKYGRAVDTGGFIENIYKSVSNAPAGSDLAPLLPDFEAVPGSDLEKSYKMNLANFKAFAANDAAARDGSLAALYTGQNNSGVADVAISTSNQLVSRVQERVRHNSAIRAMLREDWCDTESQVASAMNSCEQNYVWVGGFGMWEDAGSNNGMAGYRYEAAGFIGGYDRAYGPLTVGGVFAYARGDYSDKTAISHDSTISSYSAALHGTYNRADGLYASGVLGYTYSDNKLNELRGDASVSSGTSWNSANYHSNTINGSLEFGYDLVTDAGWRITPSVGVRHIRTYIANHREELGGVTAGRITDVDKDATFIPVRFDVSCALLKGPEASLRLNAGIGYTYNITDNGIGGAFDPYGFENAYRHRVKGRQSDQHFVNASAGLQFVAGPVDFGAQYEFTGSSHSRIHRLNGSVGFSF